MGEPMIFTLHCYLDTIPVGVCKVPPSDVLSSLDSLVIIGCAVDNVALA